jgi:hypothetical protein
LPFLLEGTARDLPQVLLDDRKTKTENRTVCQVPRTQLTNTTLKKPRRRKRKKGLGQETLAY